MKHTIDNSARKWSIRRNFRLVEIIVKSLIETERNEIEMEDKNSKEK